MPLKIQTNDPRSVHQNLSMWQRVPKGILQGHPGGCRQKEEQCGCSFREFHHSDLASQVCKEAESPCV